MFDLEKRIKDAIKQYCDNKDSMHIPPKNTDVDVVLSDCLMEITELKQKLEKLESGEFVLVPKEPNEKAFNALKEIYVYDNYSGESSYSLTEIEAKDTYKAMIEAVEEDDVL